MKACLAIPVFDHGYAVGEVVAGLAHLGLPCLIVDDGSSAETQAELARLEARYDWIEVLRHPENRGRGAALRTAYRVAAERGMSHVIQIDADGQHDPADVPKFIEAATARPEALVLGEPVFDETIPWHRLYGRQLSRAIVWIQTWSMAVRDPLCGFRCIPLATAMPLLEGSKGGDRMDFDPEFVIRLVRAGAPVVNVPTRVRYPEGGVSHFRMLEDNLLIAAAYARLALPVLSRRGSPKTGTEARVAPEWASASERGSRLLLNTLVWCIKRVGGAPLRPLLVPIAAYYTIFAGSARRASRAYLLRISRVRGDEAKTPGLRDTFWHFYEFAELILDRLDLWAGALDRFDIVLHGRERVKSIFESGRGAVMVGAHLGSFDLLRVIAREASIPVNVLMYTANAEQINEAFEALDPDSNVRVIRIDPLSSRTAFEVRACIDRCEFVAVLADRALPGSRNRTVPARFLGELAVFPEGPFRIATAMRVPVVMAIALKKGPRRYDVFLEEISSGERVLADQREAFVREAVEKFALRLEHYCLEAPLQWFNFFDFWARPEDDGD